MKARNKYGSAYPRQGHAAAGDARRVRPPPGPAAEAGPASGAASSPTDLKLPHERDEAVDPGGGQVDSEQVAQAYRDVRRGLTDTDRSAEVHKTYAKQKT
jgi:hypothetical protein